MGSVGVAIPFSQSVIPPTIQTWLPGREPEPERTYSRLKGGTRACTHSAYLTAIDLRGPRIQTVDSSAVGPPTHIPSHDAVLWRISHVMSKLGSASCPEDVKNQVTEHPHFNPPNPSPLIRPSRSMKLRDDGVPERHSPRCIRGKRVSEGRQGQRGPNYL